MKLSGAVGVPQEKQGHRAPTRCSLLTNFYFATYMISDTHKRSVYWMWVVLGAVLACARLLLGVRCAEQVIAPQEDSQAVLIRFGLEERTIDLEIERCILQDPGVTVFEKVSECITEVNDYFDSLSKEQKTQPYCFSIEKQNFECDRGCCEEFMVRLVQKLAGIEGLHVKELAVGSCNAVDIPMPEELFIEKPGRPLVVDKLFFYEVSSTCFHRICSVVQVCSSDEASRYGLVIDGVAHIDFARYPLECPWSVSRIIIDRAKTADLGPSVYRLASGAKAEDSAAPGLWVRDKVMVESEGNCCMSGSIAAIIERGIPVEASGNFLGIRVESTPKTELPEAVYRAVRAIRRVKGELEMQMYVVVPHEAYRQQDPKALKELAEQLNRLFEEDPKQQTDLMRPRMVELRDARQAAPFMCIDVEKSHGEGRGTWGVRVEQDVLASPEACAEAVAKLAQHGAYVYIMETGLVLQHAAKAVLSSSSRADITGSHGMTLFPCGCFEEDALNEAWHGKVQGCKSSESMPYRDFTWITLSLQPDGSVHMAMPRAVPVFAKPTMNCDLVYRARKASGCSMEIRVFRVPEEAGVCAGGVRRQYLMQIYPEIIDAINKWEDEYNKDEQFKTIILVPGEPMCMEMWVYVCVHVLEALSQKLVYANTVEIRGVQKAEEESVVYPKAVVGHLLSEKAKAWPNGSAMRLKTKVLCVEQGVVKYLPLLSRVVETKKLTVAVASEGPQVHIPEKDSVSANPVQRRPSRSITAASSCISEIMYLLDECEWNLKELRVCRKHRVCRGAPQPENEEAGTEDIQEGWRCQRLVVERELVFERLEDVSGYFEWKKRGGMRQDLRVKEYPGLEVSEEDSKKVWVDDKAFNQGEDSRPRAQAYLEALVGWYPEGMHVVFQVRESAETEYAIARAYAFSPRGNMERWQEVQARPDKWQAELEVQRYYKGSEGACSEVYTVCQRVYLVPALAKQPEYGWVHVPGWAMATAELKKATLGILEGLFGAVHSMDSYCAEDKVAEPAGGTSTPAGSGAEEDQCVICLNKFNFTPTAADLSKTPTANNPGPDITVIRCGHVYHRLCFEVYSGGNGGSRMSKVLQQCAMCKVDLNAERQGVSVGQIDTVTGQKAPRGKEDLKVVPDYADSIYEHAVTWSVADIPRKGESVTRRARKRRWEE